jgi:transglutaminase-like putative cysteine protease
MTRYKYQEPISLCYNEVRLVPRNLVFQTTIDTLLEVEPEPFDFRSRNDFFGNSVTYFSIQKIHSDLSIKSTNTIQLFSKIENEDSEYPILWTQAKERLRNDLQPEILEARQFVLDSPMVLSSNPLVVFAEPSFKPGWTLFEAAEDLMHRIFEEFKYGHQATSVATPLEAVLEMKQGVCQDFAHVFVGCMRSMGLAARYVSGYIETRPPEGRQRLIGADASHAWASVFIPDIGWMDFDPTNDRLAGDQHITVAWGRDYSDVAPVKGVIYSSGGHNLSVSVDVSRIS